MKSGSLSSYRAAGAMGDGDGPDESFEHAQARRRGEAAQSYIDEYVRIYAAKLAAAGIVVDCDFHTMLAAAFCAGARHEASHQITAIHQDLDRYAV